MTRKLESFITYSQSANFLCTNMLKRLEAAYSKVWPCSLDDEDIRSFLGILYLATCYFKPRLVLQTGTFVGSSSLSIALALKQNKLGRLYTIHPEPPEYFGVKEPVSIARRVVRNEQLSEQVRFLKGYSTLPLDASRIKLVTRPHWQLRKISQITSYDMLVVDGDHTFLGCYLDLVYGASGLDRTGPRILVIHDYLGISEVQKAVDKWRAQFSSLVMQVVPSSCGIALMQLP